MSPIFYVVFITMAVCYSFLAFYFLWRFILHRRITSLVVFFLAPGWAVAALREVGWLARRFTSPLIALAFMGGVFGVLITLQYELQQRRPFR